MDGLTDASPKVRASTFSLFFLDLRLKSRHFACFNILNLNCLVPTQDESSPVCLAGTAWLFWILLLVKF